MKMKQTAVEWLHEKLATSQLEDMQKNINLWFQKAKEMEKEQSYSEEEVIAFGEFIFKHSLLTHTRGVKSLFEQFKQEKNVINR